MFRLRFRYCVRRISNVEKVYFIGSGGPAAWELRGAGAALPRHVHLRAQLPRRWPAVLRRGVDALADVDDGLRVGGPLYGESGAEDSGETE
jgi:hypothetical protein